VAARRPIADGASLRHRHLVNHGSTTRRPISDFGPPTPAWSRVPPPAEPGVSAAIEEAFDDEGMTILTGAEVMSVRRDTSGRSVHMKTAAGREQELAYGEILVAAGHRPVTGGLNLDAAGVKTSARDQIVTGGSNGPRTRGSGQPGISRTGRRSSTSPPPKVWPPPPTRRWRPRGRWTPCAAPGDQPGDRLRRGRRGRHRPASMSGTPRPRCSTLTGCWSSYSLAEHLADKALFTLRA
jgi:pyridine nucleotide-disulfide oxidoreductase